MNCEGLVDSVELIVDVSADYAVYFSGGAFTTAFFVPGKEINYSCCHGNKWKM